MEDLHNVAGHEYLLSIYSVIVWYVILFSIAKDKRDDKNGEYKIAWWWKLNKDNVLATLMICPLVVVFDDELLVLYNEWVDNPIKGVNNLVYVTAGPLTSLIMKGITKLAK